MSVNSSPHLAISVAMFTRPLRALVQSQFGPARAAARHMVKQHRG